MMKIPIGMKKTRTMIRSEFQCARMTRRTRKRRRNHVSYGLWQHQPKLRFGRRHRFVDQRHQRFDRPVDQLDQLVDQRQRRFDRLVGQLDQRFDQLVDQLDQLVGQLVDHLDQLVDQLVGQLVRVGQDFRA